MNQQIMKHRSKARGSILMGLLVSMILSITFQTASASTTGTSGTIASTIRGGVSSSSPYELNPNYIPTQGQQRRRQRLSNPIRPPPPPAPTVTLGDLNADGTTSSSSQTHQFYQNYDSFQPLHHQPLQKQLQSPSAILVSIQQYMQRLHRTSPTLSIGSLFCIVTFFLWQLPSTRSLLSQFFLCRWDNVLSRPVSLLLSAFSHQDVWHLGLNLMAFVTLGPKLRAAFSSSAPPANSLWPLVLGSALVGNLSFLVLSKSNAAACMGLSGVTMAFLAVLSKLFPDSELGILVAFIPIRLPSNVALKILLAMSVFGSLTPSRGIAHAAHLGGLLFGMLYYEMWTRQALLQQLWKRSILARIPSLVKRR